MANLQLNLLPDIKMQANKQQQTRNLLISGSIIISAICFGLFLIMAITVYGIQKKQLHDSDQKIQTTSNTLTQIPNLNRVLTVQNQLTSLVGLHQSKHKTSRLFDYLAILTPNNVSISQSSIDLSTNALRLNGVADSQHSVNTFIDSLKFAQFKMGKQGNSRPAFSAVVEDSFGITTNGVNYAISAKFDPQLFANAKLDSDGKPINPIMNIPQTTTTRSALNDPSSLFQGGTR